MLNNGNNTIDVLIDATPLQSEHKLRGVGAYVRELLKAIETFKTKLSIRYLAASHQISQLKDIVPAHKVVSYPRGHKPAQVYWHYNELFLRWALYRQRPKVFLATDFNGLIHNPYGRTLAVLYDLTFLQMVSERTMNLSQFLSQWRWRAYARKLRNAEHLISISHYSAKNAVELLGLVQERITVIHLGVNHDRFYPQPDKGRYASSTPFFLSLGGFNDNKNQVRILEAYSQLPSQYQTQLFFAGAWSPEALSWLRKRSQELGIHDRVKHIGYVSHDDLASLYSNALALVFPSLEEGFGLPVLEAMACGTPVITSNQSSLPEVAGVASMLVNPNASCQISEAMLKLLERPSMRVQLETLGIQQARSFSWQGTAERTLAVLEQNVDLVRR